MAMTPGFVAMNPIHDLAMFWQGGGNDDDPHSVLGQALLRRHSWRDTVFLVEFLMNTNWQEIKLPKPYGESSKELQKEIEALLTMQADSQRYFLRDEIVAQSYDYVGLFENLCLFDAHSHPITSSLVQTVNLIGWTVVQYFKERIGRKRPSILDLRVRPLIKVPSHASYPSGHATQAYLTSFALKDVLKNRIPNIGRALEELAQQIAVNREWAGVHFHSDTIAGAKLASDLWKLARSNRNFENYIKEADAEWDRAVQSGYSFLSHK